MNHNILEEKSRRMRNNFCLDSITIVNLPKIDGQEKMLMFEMCLYGSAKMLVFNII